MFHYNREEKLPSSSRIYSYELVKESIFDLIYRGDIKAVSAKIKKGVSVDSRNDKDQTLLHYAILYNQVAIARLLISLGANLEAQDITGQTIKDVIQSRYPDLYDSLYVHISSSLHTIEHGYVQDTQIQELGHSDDYCCCIIS